MTAKKTTSKKTKNDTSSKKEPPVVTHVVEVVEVVDDEAEEQVSHVENKSKDKEEEVVVEVASALEEMSAESTSDESDEELDVDLDIIDADVKKRVQKSDDSDTADDVEDEEQIQEKKKVASIFSKKSSDVMPEVSVHKTSSRKSSKGLYVWAIGMFFMAITVGAGLLFFSKNGSSSIPNVVAQPTETPAPTEAPSPTPTPEPIDKSEVSVQVLNGSGQAGAAGAMKSVLEELGYSVDDTGNADEYSYDETEISVKETFEGLLDELEEDLEDSYVVGSATADLPEDYEYDVRVIVGAE